MKKYIIIFFFILIIISCSNNMSSNDLYIYPTSYKTISSNYGERELYGNLNFHNGIDFLAPLGSEIYASASGYVVYASFLKDGYGNTIIISHDNNTKTLYCHVSENFIVSVNQYVSQGEIIGYVGPKFLSNGIQNGNTTGPHLHFSVFKNDKTINPLEILK